MQHPGDPACGSSGEQQRLLPVPELLHGGDASDGPRRPWERGGSKSMVALGLLSLLCALQVNAGCQPCPPFRFQTVMPLLLLRFFFGGSCVYGLCGSHAGKPRGGSFTIIRVIVIGVILVMGEDLFKLPPYLYATTL